MPTRSKHTSGQETRGKQHEAYEARGKRSEKKMGDMPGNQAPNTPNKKESGQRRKH